MKINLKLFDIRLALFLSFVFILITNSYFTFEESLKFGASDGADYYLIADSYNNIPHETLAYHKAWRFIVPIFVGIIAESFNLETYFVFRILVVISCLSLIVFFFKILKKLKIKNFHIFFLTSLIIFNPYLFRYFLASPTMINDLLFINAGLLIVLSIIKNNKNILYVGFFLATITRQNAIFYLLSILIVKFIFKNNSFIKYKDLCLVSILTLFIFFINNMFANHYTDYNDTYSLFNRFNIFVFNYSLLDFIKYNLFPLIILLPLILYIIFEKDFLTIKKIRTELFSIILLMVIFVTSVAYVGGPMVTGKNLIRLINLSYPLIILLLVLPFELKKNKNNFLKYIFYTPLFAIWSLHPTFSNIKSYLFEF
jgi:hypothetical protein